LLVKHEGRENQVRAKRCVVTVPVTLLGTQASEGSIEFVPALDSRREALTQLAMGHVAKLVLRFVENPFEHRAPKDAEFIHAIDSVFPTFWLQSKNEQHQVTAWSGGPNAIALSGIAPAEISERALVSLASLLDTTPDVLRRDLCGVHFHDFSRDPFALGAYAYVRPGPLDSRELRKRLVAPIEDTLFFAGEAIDQEYPGTVAGALGSGEHAARRVLAAYNIDQR
jgi:monoamine oxidase